MKIAETESLSTVHTGTSRRMTKPTIRTLQFIHRFRHVTTRHIQLALGHANLTTTNIHLSRLTAQGYISRIYDASDKTAKRPASYYLTPVGLNVLKEKYPERSFRRVRSLQADASMSRRSREHYHVLADVYVHFKRHYDGYFEFFSAFDIAELAYMPDETPDGYVRVNLPGLKTQHYLIEVYGWARSIPLQRRRLYSYLQFAESECWQLAIDSRTPYLFAIAGDRKSRSRLEAELKRGLEECLTDDFKVCTTTAPKLDSEVSAIWREVSSST